MNNFIHHKMYFKVAKDKLSVARQGETSYRNWANDPNPWIKLDDIDKSFYVFLEAAVVSVLFSELTVEAYINYYGISRLTESRFYPSLEKLPIRKKWIDIPVLVTGKSIGTNSEAATLLKELVESRNSLVHYKSSGNSPQEFYAYLKNFDARNQDAQLPWLENAEKGVKTVYKLIDELAKIDNSINRAEIEWEEDADNWYQSLSVIE